MMGPSQPSFSSSSRSGQCPTGPQAWAKPMPWDPWVRVGPRQGGTRSRVRGPESTDLSPALLPEHASCMCTFTLALDAPGGVGTQRDLEKLKGCHKKGAENSLTFIWSGVGSPWNPENFSLPDNIC